CLFAAGHPGVGALLGRLRRSRLYRKSLRQLTVPGNALVRIDVPRRGCVSGTCGSGARLWWSRQLESVHAARRAVDRYQGRNQALPTTKYSAVVPGLCATSMPASIPNLLASL